MKYGAQDAQYEGQWTRDVKHGYGSYRFPSGAQYVGQWYEGKMHGQVRHGTAARHLPRGLASALA